MARDINPDQFKQEYQMTFADLAPAFSDWIWKIEQGQLVFVSDKQGNLHEHTMKQDAAYSEHQLANLVGDPCNPETPYRHIRFYPSRAFKGPYTAQELFAGGFLTIETGNKQWPFIVLSKEAPIVVYGTLQGFVRLSRGTCRKLGY